MLVLTCACGNRMRVPDDAIGKAGKCPQCHEVIKITAENTESQDAPAPAPAPPAPQAPAARSSDAKSNGGPPKKRIGELLQSEGLISKGELREALDTQKKQGGKIVEVLISLGYLTVEAFVNFLAKQPGVASLDLAHYQIPSEIVSLLPRDLAVRHEVFPIDKMGRLLTLGMACPLDSSAIEEIERATELRVKALLCAPNDIRSAIREHYGEENVPEMPDPLESVVQNGEPAPQSVSKVQSSLKLSGVIDLVKQIKSLPALPETVARVREAMDDLTISPNDVAETIERDPPIAANVLSVANSAAYGFSHRVDSVDLAVALLGLRETYSIVMSAAVLDLFEKTHNFDYKIYWEEAMNSAAASRIIAHHCGHQNDRSLFTAGLLHDIGRIALLEIVPDKYLEIAPELSGDELIAAEQEVIGIAHTEAGFELASNWNLPPEIAEPIRFHHQPDFSETNREEVAIVTLAELWTRTHVLEQGDKASILERSAPLFEILNLSEAESEAAFEEVAGLEPVQFQWKTASGAA